MQICPLDPRSGVTSAAGLLTRGSSPFGAFPSRFIGTVTGSCFTDPNGWDGDRRSPCRRTPQLQWRARAGVTPAFLFFPTWPLPGNDHRKKEPHRDTARYSISARKVRSWPTESQR
jgi:hypothetical protein